MVGAVSCSRESEFAGCVFMLSAVILSCVAAAGGAAGASRGLVYGSRRRGYATAGTAVAAQLDVAEFENMFRDSGY